MPNSNTPESRAARLAATRRQERERKAAGWRRISVWLPPDAVDRLDWLSAECGGIGAAIEAALREKSTISAQSRFCGGNPPG